MTPVRVRGLTTHGSDEAVLELETLPADRRLALLVPLDEAHRLARVLGLGPCQCAPIYDLIGELAHTLGARISGAILDVEAGHIVARLLVASADRTSRLACHPADAVALAVRASMPICLTDTALAQACPADAHQSPPGWGTVTQWIDRVRPGDFLPPPA